MNGYHNKKLFQETEYLTSSQRRLTWPKWWPAGNIAMIIMFKSLFLLFTTHTNKTEYDSNAIDLKLKFL